MATRYIALAFVVIISACQSSDMKEVEMHYYDNGKVHDKLLESKDKKTLQYFEYDEQGKIWKYAYSDSLTIPKLYEKQGGFFSEKDLRVFYKDDKITLGINGMQRDMNPDSTVRSIYFVDQITNHYMPYGSHMDFYKNSVISLLSSRFYKGDSSFEYHYTFTEYGKLKSEIILLNSDTLSIKPFD